MPTAPGRSLARWRAFYGENPMHLLALLGCFALAGYAVSFAAQTDTPTALLLAAWFVGAVLGHDLVLFPLYALADRSLLAGRRARRRRTARPTRVPATNHIRAPLLGSALLALIFLPVIIRQGEASYTAAAGLTMGPFLGRWLLITGVLFLISAVAYAVRLARAAPASQRRSSTSSTASAPG